MTANPSTSPGPPAERLDSWKEIARYLKRDESTVQRWEKRESMPVHRHVHDKRGSVYAYRAELDAWWQGRRQQLEPRKGEGAVLSAHSGREAGDRRRWWWIGTAATLLLIPIGLLALKWLPQPWTLAKRSELTLVRLTSTSGLNIDPALSPDGSLLAYASDRGGAGDMDIWVQPLGGEQPTRVTSDSGDELEPSFSPSGDSIVFSKGQSGGIYIVRTDGGEPGRLVGPARTRTPRFSPDGRWVTYWTGPPVWVLPSAPGATGALFVVPASGGSPRPLAPDFAHARYGTWSPHAEKILFVGERESDGSQSSLDWYVVGVGGGEPVRTGAVEVLRGAGVKGVPIPGAWTRDGGAVVFATYDQGASNVWQLAISPVTGRVAGQPVRLTFGTAIERTPAVSSSGSVVFTSFAENVDIWRLPLDAATGLASGASEQVTDSAANDRLSNTSDDGQTVAFVSSRTGQDEVWTRDVPSGDDRQITHVNAPLALNPRSARLSRDGSTVAVARGVSEMPGIDLVPLAGGPASPFCDDCAAGDWSPDGRRLVVLRGSPTRLVVRDVGSGREKELAAHSEWNLFQPRFSPDGRWIVFHTTNNPSLRQIYVVPAFSDGPVPTNAWVQIVPDFGVHPSWAPDGSAVYHFSLRDGAFCAWLQPLDPATKRPIGPPRAVQHLHHPGLRAAGAAGATNHVAAGYLYVTLAASSANIWMLQP